MKAGRKLFGLLCRFLIFRGVWCCGGSCWWRRGDLAYVVEIEAIDGEYPSRSVDFKWKWAFKLRNVLGSRKMGFAFSKVGKHGHEPARNVWHPGWEPMSVICTGSARKRIHTYFAHLHQM